MSWKKRGKRSSYQLSPRQRWSSGTACQKGEENPTYPDGSCPDPGGHPHGQVCASRGWQDPRAARKKKKHEGSPLRSHPYQGRPSCTQRGRVRDPRTRPFRHRDSFPRGATRFPASHTPLPSTAAIGSGPCSESGQEGARSHCLQT